MLTFKIYKRFIINLTLTESAYQQQLYTLIIEIHSQFSFNSIINY